jgi:CheY-like chemotaxis protein
MNSVAPTNPRPPIALVVDDEPFIRMDAADIISSEGYSIVEARTADEAFAYLEAHPSPQLLFTDIETPGKLNGILLAQQVGRRWPHICVIVSSGATRPKASDLPETATFIAKPFSAQLVIDTIREFCAALHRSDRGEPATE